MINLVFALVPIFVTLVTVPLYIEAVGLERYGILSLIWLLAGMFGFLDLGMGAATNYMIARAHSDPSATPIGAVVSTTAVINFGIGCILGMMFWIALGPLAFGNVEGTESLKAEIQEAIVWIALLAPLTLAAAVFRHALDGQRKFITVNSIGTIGQAMTVVVALIVAIVFGPELTNLVLSIVLVRLAMLVCYMVFVFATVKIERFMNRTELAELIKFGGWQTLFSSLTGLVSALDRFVVGWISGAGATATYAIAFSLSRRLGFFASAFMRTLYPRLSSVVELSTRRELVRRALNSVSCVMLCVTVPSIIIVRPFLSLWLGEELDQTVGPIAQVLLIAFFMQTLLSVLFIFKRASGLPETPAKVRAVTTIPFIITLITLVSLFGGIGAAYALAVRFGFELVWMLNSARLMSVTGWVIGCFAMCVTAVFISFLEYGIVLGGVLAATTIFSLGFISLRVSSDVAALVASLAGRLKQGLFTR
ncbi:MAG: oligosaccharide flippase family protein [Pseudomonadota bacterium]